jgi:hypothetical protein
LGRPAKKRKYAEGKAERKGQLQAEREYEKSIPLEMEFKRFLKDALAKIEPLEAVAITGMTIIIKGTIDTSEELLEKIKTPLLAASLISPILVPFLPLALYQQVPEKLKEVPDWAEWLLSFAMAYVLVKHGGQMFGLLDKGLKQVVSLMLS